MSEDNFNQNNNNNPWEELAKQLESVTTENTSEPEPNLLQAGIELNKLFDALVAGGFTGEQAIRLIAEIVTRGK